MRPGRPGLRWLHAIVVALIAAALSACDPVAYHPVAVAVDGIGAPVGITVGPDGTVYVAGADVVVALTDDGQHALPFDATAMHFTAVPVDDSGTVYAAGLTKGAARPRVLKLAAGQDEPTVLLIPELSHPVDVAPGPDGRVYLVDDTGVTALVPD